VAISACSLSPLTYFRHFPRFFSSFHRPGSLNSPSTRRKIPTTSALFQPGFSKLSDSTKS
jgi:hypothetical protein